MAPARAGSGSCSRPEYRSDPGAGAGFWASEMDVGRMGQANRASSELVARWKRRHRQASRHDRREESAAGSCTFYLLLLAPTAQTLCSSHGTARSLTLLGLLGGLQTIPAKLCIQRLAGIYACIIANIEASSTTWSQDKLTSCRRTRSEAEREHRGGKRAWEMPSRD